MHSTATTMSSRYAAKWFFRKISGFGFDVPVQDDLSLLIEDAEIHRSCVQIDTTVKFVLLGVKSHLRPPLGKVFGYLNHTCFGYGSRGP